MLRAIALNKQKVRVHRPELEQRGPVAVDGRTDLDVFLLVGGQVYNLWRDLKSNNNLLYIEHFS